jgi:beta-lactam-binding protein with PASTA domain
VFAVILFLISTQLSKSSSQQVVVQAVTTKPVAEATSILQGQGFKVDAQVEPNTDYAAGIVFDQSPRGGQQAPKGSTVTLKVSAGLGQGDVPSVVGLNKAAATSLLENSGFVADPVPQNDPKAPVDQVISQNPAAQQKADKGSKVTIVVSSGPATVGVPDVSGQSAGTASATIIAAGFKVTESQQSSDSVPAGKVIGTNPDAGVSVAPGTTVRIIVSTGPAVTTTTTAATTTTTHPAVTTTTHP